MKNERIRESFGWETYRQGAEEMEGAFCLCFTSPLSFPECGEVIVSDAF